MIETLKQTLEALENHEGNYKLSSKQGLVQANAQQALRDAIARLEKQEPDYRSIAYAIVGNLEGRKQVINLDLEEELVEEIMQEMTDTIRDGFHPAPAVPEGWLRAVDEELTSSHLGIASSTDTYEDAKKKLAMLIDWNIAVATDPKVNGGWKLVPIEATVEMVKASWDLAEVAYVEGRQKLISVAYKAMLAAAPEVTK